MRRVVISAFVLIVVGITAAALWTSVFARGGVVLIVPKGSTVTVSVDGGDEMTVSGREIIALRQGSHQVAIGDVVHEVDVSGREDVFILPVGAEQCYAVRNRSSGDVIKEYRKTEAFHVPRSYYRSEDYELETVPCP